ncbi:MAG: outer membrane beta-barrel protein [Gammaproteobacteria bacterium]|nr:outer membrane beta-barrel protein [Gammaproteobacteria bacterium]
MKKTIPLFILMSSAAMASINIQAEGLDAKRVYVGGGLSFNNAPDIGSARGFQFFAGYELNVKLNEDISTALEIGYMDSGNFKNFDSRSRGDATGLWFAALESVPLSNKTDMLVRLGYDFGDDDGLLLGAGMQYKFDTKVALRMEYVTRENVNGLQANVVLKF